MRTLFLAASTAVVLSGMSAQASTFQATYQTLGNVFGAENLYRVVDIRSPGYNGQAKAGLFQLNGGSGIGDFAAFCADLFQYVRSPDTYSHKPDLFGASIRTNIDKLYTSAYHTVTTAVNAAAFQVALWEIIYDDGNVFDLDAGSFKTTSSSNASVEAQADSLLDGLAGAGTGGYKVTYLHSEGGQDLVTVSPVPLPAAGWMLVAGVGGLLALRRKLRAAG